MTLDVMFRQSCCSRSPRAGAIVAGEDRHRRETRSPAPCTRAASPPGCCGSSMTFTPWAAARTAPRLGALRPRRASAPTTCADGRGLAARDERIHVQTADLLGELVDDVATAPPTKEALLDHRR